jgi:hypothetical protein
MKYRKLPVVIEAEQFFENMDDWPDGVYACDWSPTGFGINTLEGTHEVSEGDFIITGVAGERYPCKSQIFWRTYEVVGDNE